MKKTWKNQKPIDTDAHFKYRCPDKDCGLSHWLSLKESQTKNFKVVCSCGTIFTPKRIFKIKIAYHIVVKKSLENNKPIESEVENIEIEIAIPIDILDSCANLLIGYGFTKDEAVNLITRAYEKCENKDPSNLIKFALQNLENSHVD